jgi:hypothetical protein
VRELEERPTGTPSPTGTSETEDFKRGPDNPAVSNVEMLKPKSRVQYVLSKVNTKGDRIEVEGEEPNPQVIETRDDIAFVAKETFKDATGQEKLPIKVTLKSLDLRRLLQTVLAKHFDHDKLKGWDTKEQTLTLSFRLQLLYWNELQEAVDNPELGTEQGRNDLKLLLEYIERVEPENVELVKSIETRTRISSKDIWALFRPGDLVVATPYLDEPQIFQVHSQKNKDGYDIAVVCWAYDWTGTELERHYYEFTLKIMDDDGDGGDITKLACYPIRYYKGKDGLTNEQTWSKELIKRGRTFEDLCKESITPGKLYSYTGDMLVESNKPEHWWIEDREAVS